MLDIPDAVVSGRCRVCMGFGDSGLSCLAVISQEGRGSGMGLAQVLACLLRFRVCRHFGIVAILGGGHDGV